MAKEVPDFSKTKEALKEDGLSDQEIKQKLNELKESYGGLVTDRDVLAHMLAKKRGVSVDSVSAKQVKTGEIEQGMQDIRIRGYVVGRDLTETRTGEERSVITLVDDEGYVRGNVFGEGSARWNYEFGQPVEISCDTYSSQQRTGISTWDKPRILDEDDLDYDLEEIATVKISEIDDLDSREFVRVEGLCTNFEKRTYTGCPNCRRKINNCDCKQNYGEQEFAFKELEIIPTHGNCSVVAEATPGTKLNEEKRIETSHIEIYGIYDPEQEQIDLNKLNVLRTIGEPEETEETEELEKEMMDFVDRYGSTPKHFFIKYAINECGVQDEDRANELLNKIINKGKLKLTDEGEVKIND